MNSISDQYKELSQLLRTHLEDEFPSNERLFVDAESYAFFRKQAQQQIQTQSKQTPQQPPTPSPAPPQAIAPKKAYTPPPPPPLPAPAPAPLPVAQPKPTPQPKVEKVEAKNLDDSAKKPFFAPEPLSKAGIVDLGAVGKTFETLFPQLYVAEIPKAKQQSSAALFVLCIETAPEKRAFVNQLARALFTIYGQVRMIAPEQLTQAQGVLIAPNSYAEQLKTHAGGLVLLDDIELYLKEPARKAILWETLKPLCAK